MCSVTPGQVDGSPEQQKRLMGSGTRNTIHCITSLIHACSGGVSESKSKPVAQSQGRGHVRASSGVPQGNMATSAYWTLQHDNDSSRLLFAMLKNTTSVCMESRSISARTPTRRRYAQHLDCRVGKYYSGEKKRDDLQFSLMTRGSCIRRELVPIEHANASKLYLHLFRCLHAVLSASDPISIESEMSSVDSLVSPFFIYGATSSPLSSAAEVRHFVRVPVKSMRLVEGTLTGASVMTESHHMAQGSLIKRVQQWQCQSCRLCCSSGQSWHGVWKFVLTIQFRVRSKRKRPSCQRAEVP